jgi:thiol-disulfide isomerase/thioredoxin
MTKGFLSKLKGGSLFGGESSSLYTNSKMFSWKNLAIIISIVIIIIISLNAYKYFTNSKHTQYKINNQFNSVNNDSENGTPSEAEIIIFYVDWCPHCKTAMNQGGPWDVIKKEYDGKVVNGYKIIFTEVNCTEETSEIEKMIEKYKIEGYPTIKMLKNGQVIEFDSKPSVETLSQFINTVV